MFRRGFMTVVLSSMLSGCVALSGGGGGYMEIHNRTTAVQTVSVTLVQRESQNTVLDDTYRVEPDSKRRIDDAFTGGVFQAEVSVDAERRKEYELGVGRCPNIGFLIGVETNELHLDQGSCD